MNESIVNHKKQLLTILQQEKSAIEATLDSRVAQAYASKKPDLDAKCREIDEALANYTATIQAEANEKITNKRNEVLEKKKALEQQTVMQAQAEAQSSIAIEVADYVSEIASLEKQLG